MRLEDITAIVLCGGTGSRLGAPDKTLAPMLGRPLVSYAIAGLAPQVGRVMLSCGRDLEPYASLGHAVVIDEHPGDGPLGGLASALSAVETDWVLAYPGDMPFPDHGLVARLGPTADARGMAVPRTGKQRQHLVLLLSSAMATELAGFYESGGRAIRLWLDEYEVVGVDMTDVADSFFNVNTPADLVEAEERATRG